MQTLTHGLIGISIGALSSRNPLLQFVCFAGAIAPDGPTALQFVLDKLRKRPVLAVQGPLLMLSKNTSHSTPLWIFLTIGSLYLPEPLSLLGFAFGVGGFSHIAIDLFTHGDPRFQRHDCLYFWPLQRRPYNIGTWDYRIKEGILWPLKPFEDSVFKANLAIITVCWTFQITLLWIGIA